VSLNVFAVLGFYDTLIIFVRIRALIENSSVEPSQKARFLASLAPHSGDWLLALPIANCGLRLDDEAVSVAVGMRLGLSLCVPHSCPCGEQVDGCPWSPCRGV